MLNSYILVGICAIVGAFARWKFSVLYNPIISSFPLGTLLVNVVGSFLIGIVFGISTKIALPSVLKTALTVGFLGSFTTFSGFSIEVVLLFMNNNYFYATLLILAHVVGSILMTLAGIYATTLL